METRGVFLTGEIIHGLGNSIVQGDTQLGQFTLEDGKILQELGHALRVNLNDGHPAPDHSFPTTLSQGFNPCLHTKETILEILASFIGNEGLLSFKQSVASNTQ